MSVLDFLGKYSVLDFVLKGEKEVLACLGRGRKQEMYVLPVPTVEAGAPFGKEFCKLLCVGENGAGGENCRYGS